MSAPSNEKSNHRSALPCSETSRFRYGLLKSGKIAPIGDMSSMKVQTVEASERVLRFGGQQIGAASLCTYRFPANDTPETRRTHARLPISEALSNPLTQRMLQQTLRMENATG